MKLDLRFLSSLSLVAALGMTGCPADDDPEETGGDTETSSTGATDPTEDTDPTTNPSGTTENPSGTSEGETTVDPSEGSTDTTDGETTAAPDPLPNGSECTMDAQCESEACSVIAPAVGSGVCGECSSDDACEFGCSPGIPMIAGIFPNPVAPTCHDGSDGNACESAEACATEGSTCVELLNVSGILNISGCSSCETTADCTEQVCNLSLDIPTVSGQWSCVDEGSVPDGSSCDYGKEGDGDGTLACDNVCAPVSIAGLLDVGVCGACAVDEDCADGETCVEGEFGDDGSVTPSSCAAK